MKYENFLRYENYNKHRSEMIRNFQPKGGVLELNFGYADITRIWQSGISKEAST